MESDSARIAAWFAGPKAENGEWFADCIRRIVQDYHSWRRNYFPGDGSVVDSALRRLNEPFRDEFEDRLGELLARLKDDFPFYSPRYAAHMLAEQSLPGIAAYFATMLYNPNNVSEEAAPVTVRLELEAARMIARMLGYGDESWAHLTGGGTIANIEALWIARTVAYLPLVVRDMRRVLGLPPEPWPDEPRRLVGMNPGTVLAAFARCFAEAGPGATERAIAAYRASPFNVAERGLAAVGAETGLRPLVFLPETHHYCFDKAMDALGIGRAALVRVRVDADFRMVVADLGERLDRAEAEGGHAIAVIGVVGTTEEGAVDPVNEILDLRARREAAGTRSFWIHIDAAYGGYLRTVTVPSRLGLGEPRARVEIEDRLLDLPLRLPEHSACDALERLGECDSITIDPHKLGYVPYPAGAACFRSNLVKPLARHEAPYISGPVADAEAEAAAEGIGPYILEGSKPGAAAAAVWLSHKLIPLDRGGHGVLIRETIRNACELHALLDEFPSLVPGQRVRAVTLCPPGSNIVCWAFRPADAGRSLAALNAANERVYERFTLRAGGHPFEHAFFISRTTLSARRYAPETVAGVLERLGVSGGEYSREGVFLLRSVLMNPWYGLAKGKGRFYVSELAAALYKAAAEEFDAAAPVA